MWVEAGALSSSTLGGGTGSLTYRPACCFARFPSPSRVSGRSNQRLSARFQEISLFALSIMQVFRHKLQDNIALDTPLPMVWAVTAAAMAAMA